MSDDRLVPAPLRSMGAPWHLADASARMEAARAQATTPGAVEQALDVLERCRRVAAERPRLPGAYDRIERTPAVKALADAWPRWPRAFETAMPTLDDVRVSRLPAGPDPAPARDTMAELARAWVDGMVPTLARQASDWLRERLAHGGTAADRARYLSLLAALVPDLGEPGNPLVTHLEMAGGLDAAAHLLCIERHPRTGATARRIAGEYLRTLERAAYPRGADLPEEVWRLRGGRLARVRRGFVRRSAGPGEDQMLELTFEDGAGIRIWAGYGGEMRFEDGPFDALPEDDPSRLDADDADGADEARLLDGQDAWYLRDESAEPAVAAALGRTLTDFVFVPHGPDEDDRAVLSLRFEAVPVAVGVAADLRLVIGWGRDGPPHAPDDRKEWEG